MKKNVVAICILLFAGVQFQSCNQSEKPAADRVVKPARAVEAVTVTTGVLNRHIEAAGVIAGINEAYVVSESQGIIRRVAFELGDSVGRGRLLVGLDNTIAKLNMERAEQQYETEKMNLNTVEKLFSNKAAAKAELVRAKASYKAAKASYETAQKAYKDCSIRAPISGYIAHREAVITVGNFCAAGSRVARIVDISSLKLEVAVGEREVSFIEEGAKAVVRVPAACEKKSFDAKVKAVAAGADAATGSYAVQIVWENTCDRRLKSGMSAVAKIETRAQEPVVLVPAAAIIEISGRDAVMLSVKKRATPAFIRQGRQAGNRIEILEGISNGDIVIVSGLTSLAKGDDVLVSIIGESGSWE
jgi:RND family efflux transporter MFP subunit